LDFTLGSRRRGCERKRWDRDGFLREGMCLQDTFFGGFFLSFLFRKGDVFVLECGESGGRLIGDGGWRGLDIFVVLTALFL